MPTLPRVKLWCRSMGPFNLSVQAVDQSGNSAVAGGDKLYFAEGDTPPISKKNTGVVYGYALGDTGVQMIATGTTATILVLLLKG